MVHQVECQTPNCNLQKEQFCVSLLEMYINLFSIVLYHQIPVSHSKTMKMKNLKILNVKKYEHLLDISGNTYMTLRITFIPAGILRDKTMANKLIYIPNDDYPVYVVYDQRLERLYTQLYEQTNQNSLKVPIVINVILQLWGLV